MRRRDLMWLAGLTAPALCLSLPVLASERELRIGLQKYGTLILLKERGLLGEEAGAARLDRQLDRVPRPGRSCSRL